MEEVPDSDAVKEEDEEESPFASLVLKCQYVPDPQDQLVLWWHSARPFIRYQVEVDLIKVLVPYEKRERGMFCKQPEHRLAKLRRICKAERIPLRVALSLRRHLIRRYNPNLSLSQLKLGTDSQVREAARLYEMAIQDFLLRESLSFYSETEQKEHIRRYRQPGQPYPPTPDFVLKEPIRIRKYRVPAGKNQKIPVGERIVIEELSVYWIEVKMFYGASIIEQDNKSAVGCLLSTAKKYVNIFGPGAMVFIHGCGERLAKELRNEEVLALDSTWVGGVDMTAVDAYMRTYCSNEQGEVLP